MPALPAPSEENDFLAPHVALMRKSFRHWMGRDFLDHRMNAAEAARYLFDAPFVVLSHDTAKDPLFNYGNRTAMNLYGLDWQTLTNTPSRLSAEPVTQEERDRLLAEVTKRGYIDNYRGARIARGGRRFMIENVIVWNLVDGAGFYRGQAAMFRDWTFL
jgi:hypothetical protein